MKKKLLLVLLSLAIMISAIGCSNTTNEALKEEEIAITEETTNNTSTEKKELRVGTPGQHYPWNFFEAGELKGADIETIQEVCSRIGYEPKFDIMAFDGLYGSVDTKRIDTGA